MFETINNNNKDLIFIEFRVFETQSNKNKEHVVD